MTPDSVEFYKNLVENMSDGVYFVDRHRRIQYWNKGANRLTACIADGKSHEDTVFLRHKMGRRVPVLVHVEPIRDANGIKIGAVEVFSDSTVLHQTQRRTKELERLAFLDELTQLPNRRYIEMSLTTTLAEFQVHNDSFGVLMLDLDGFKEINDTWGHAVGDLALQEAATSLAGSLRPNDIVGRWGGDEFVAILRSVNRTTLDQMIRRCEMLVRETQILAPDGKRLPLSVSVGGTLVHSGDSAEAILQRADERMYHAKQAKGAAR
jgi:diguanylate cyclase (GGDEF)-like protein